MSVSGSQFVAAESPSSPADDAMREKEIREAFQPILAEHRTWANDPDLKQYPPGLVLRLVQVFLAVFAAGPFPQRLAAAWVRALELANKTVAVGMGDSDAVDSSGKPKRAWIRAIEEFGEALKPKVVLNRVCPSFPRVMAEFEGDLRQHLYVARQFGIYSTDEGKWIGPLFTESGDPNATAIFRESKNPGSVIPEGFHPEDLRNPAPLVELEPVPQSLLTSLRRCLELNEVRTVEAVEDPATIEDLLCQGQYVPVIARIKNVSEAYVREVADRLGIAAKTQSDDYKPVSILNHEDEIYSLNMLTSSPDLPSVAPSLREIPEADANSESSSSAPEFPPAPSTDANRETQLTDLLRGLLEKNPDTATPQAMSVLKNSGLTATGSEVGRRLAAMRREMTSSAN